MADAPESLLRYEPPQLVVKGHQRASTKVPTFARDTALPPTEVVLNAILPPRKFEKNGKLWVQHASSVPATHLDMDALKELLELRLQQRHAREMGICPEREALYAQLFDEIIRQVTVGCAERGLLLLRVRNETMQNIYEYQNLYKSSTGCGIRVSLLAEQQQTEAAAQAELQTAEVRRLQDTAANLLKKLAEIETKEAQRFEEEERAHKEEVGALKATLDRAHLALEAMTATAVNTTY